MARVMKGIRRRKNSVFSNLEVTPEIKQLQAELIWGGMCEALWHYEDLLSSGGIQHDKMGNFVLTLVNGVFPTYLRDKYVIDSSFLYGTDGVVINPHEMAFTDAFFELAVPVAYNRYFFEYRNNFSPLTMYRLQQGIGRLINQVICSPRIIRKAF